MGIFTRYVLAELMKVFLVALTAMPPPSSSF